MPGRDRLQLFGAGGGIGAVEEHADLGFPAGQIRMVDAPAKTNTQATSIRLAIAETVVANSGSGDREGRAAR